MRKYYDFNEEYDFNEDVSYLLEYLSDDNRPEVKRAFKWLIDTSKILVPSEGRAKTKAGEVLRQVSKLVAQFGNNGVLINEFPSSARTILNKVNNDSDIKDCLDWLKQYAYNINVTFGRRRYGVEASRKEYEGYYFKKLGDLVVAVYKYFKEHTDDFPELNTLRKIDEISAYEQGYRDGRRAYLFEKE